MDITNLNTTNLTFEVCYATKIPKELTKLIAEYANHSILERIELYSASTYPKMLDVFKYNLRDETYFTYRHECATVIDHRLMSNDSKTVHFIIWHKNTSTTFNIFRSTNGICRFRNEVFIDNIDETVATVYNILSRRQELKSNENLIILFAAIIHNMYLIYQI